VVNNIPVIRLSLSRVLGLSRSLLPGDFSIFLPGGGRITREKGFLKRGKAIG